MGPARRWPIARIGTNAARRVFAPRTSLLHLHLKADDSVTWRPTGIVHSIYQPILIDARLSPVTSDQPKCGLLRITACICSMCSGGGWGASLLLRGLMTLPYGDWGCAANKQCIISGWAVVSWLGLGLGWCMADRALCERDENWHFVECTCITAPQITCGGPWLWFPFLCGPLRSGKGCGTSVRVAVENCGAKGGRSFFMSRGKYIGAIATKGHNCITT